LQPLNEEAFFSNPIDERFPDLRATILGSRTLISHNQLPVKNYSEYSNIAIDPLREVLTKLRKK